MVFDYDGCAKCRKKNQTNLCADCGQNEKGKFVDANYASFPNSVFLIVTITTIVWITVTYLTSGKESEEKRTHLFNFYKQIKPQGVWNTIAYQVGEKVQNKGLLSRFIQ